MKSLPLGLIVDLKYRPIPIFMLMADTKLNGPLELPMHKFKPNFSHCNYYMHTVADEDDDESPDEDGKKEQSNHNHLLLTLDL